MGDSVDQRHVQATTTIVAILSIYGFDVIGLGIHADRPVRLEIEACRDEVREDDERLPGLLKQSESTVVQEVDIGREVPSRGDGRVVWTVDVIMRPDP